MLSSNNRKGFVYLLFAIIFILTIIFIVLLLIFLSLSFAPSLPPKTPRQLPYSFVEYDSYLKISRSGFMRIPQQLSEEEFITYRNENNHLILISKGGTDFECTGSCFCKQEDSKSDRRTTTVLSRGMVLLLTALTSTSALKMATSVFTDHCKEKYSGVCMEDDDDAIEFEIEGCDTKRIREELKEKRMSGEKTTETWDCYGHCVLNTQSEHEWSNEIPLPGDPGNCRDIEYNTRVSVPIEEEDKLTWAVYNFCKRQLDPICKERTLYDIDDSSKPIRIVQMCVARRSPTDYSNIVCTKRDDWGMDVWTPKSNRVVHMD